jgi:hypothetical protein
MLVVLALLVALSWIGCTALCALKGRRVYAVGNLLIVGSLAGWLGAARLAKPESWWARRFYGAEKLAQATRRHTIYIRGYPR